MGPEDVEGRIDAVKEMLIYPAVRKKTAAKGKAYVARFNDDAMASGTMECYRKALEHRQ